MGDQWGSHCPTCHFPPARRHVSSVATPTQCSLPDLNREPLRPVFPGGPQPRSATRSVPCPSAASVLCRASTAIFCGQPPPSAASISLLPDLNRDHWGGFYQSTHKGPWKTRRALTCRLFKRMALFLACVRRFSSWPLWLQRALPQNIPASEAVNPQVHLKQKKKPQKQQRTKI